MEKEDAVPSDIFPHVYSFLVRFGFLKSAKLFRKEANVPRVVVNSPGLLDFYEAFKKRKNKVVDALQTEEVVASKKKRKIDKQLSKKALKKKKKQSSSSESNSSSEELKQQSTKKSANTDTSKRCKQLVCVNTKPAKEETSSSDSEPAKTNGTDGGGVTLNVLPKHKKIVAAVKKSASSSSEDSSSNDDDDNPVTTSTAKKSQEVEDDSSSNDSDTPAAKQPVPIAEPHTVPKASKKLKQKSAAINQPFFRVDKQTLVNPKLADNSFEAKSGARGSWGEKAHHVLKNTKGRSFRHEKTKKKRGSYTGGRIDTSVHSIKFDDSD